MLRPPTRRLSRILTVTITTLLALIVALPAWAHHTVILTKANTPGNAPRVVDGAVSFAFYGWMNKPLDVRSFKLTFTAGQRLYFEAIMPDLAPENTIPNHHLPQILITTPSGSLIAVPPTLREPFYEEHSHTTLIRFAKVDRVAEAGTHHIVVIGARQQRFALATGLLEAPGQLENGTIGTFYYVIHWYQTPAPYDPAGV
ncbi:hypothetical protein GCM10012289_60370 [Nonomuraea cavernae]|uniref:Uncharacterized protein n=1 Tax=Nonomuraea cavernae TaxID=2045107 RepID=A0A918DPE6_9ACTN|nr:hypothetical protein GCM10012289_60370 [Nonomuraea cavernae]